MRDFWQPFFELSWSASSNIPLPLYYSWNDQRLSLAISRWWRLKKQAALDINEAMDAVYGVIDSYNKTDGIKGTKKKILFSPSYPKYLFDSDTKAEPLDTNNVIVWSLVRREPGALSGQPFGRPKEMKPRIREELVITDAEGRLQHVEIRGQWFDNIIRFDCFAPNSKQANDLADSFETLMEQTADHLMRLGIQKIVYQGRSADLFDIGAEWQYRPVTFFFRTEKVRAEVDGAINSITHTMYNFNGMINLP